MTVYPATRGGREPTHPGTLMTEILDTLALSTKIAAERMGVTRQALHRVLAGAGALSPDMALRFCALAGGDAEMFLRMQQTLDLWRAKKRAAAALARIEPARPPNLAV
jgi:addiction module HigA family antidote